MNVKKERFPCFGREPVEDAAEILMQEYGSSCVEAGRFLDICVCEDD
jgi:hypothetical protein